MKLLAIEPTHVLPRGDLRTRLWPELGEREAEKELGKSLRDVCRALSDGWAVVDEGQRIRLWPHGELWVDAHVFAASAKHARNADQRAAAVGLYRGDLLPQDFELSQTQALRTRLRLMYLELLRDPDSATPPWIDLRHPTSTGR
ncbi:MAG: hypothetical protein M3P04_11940 [Actinomycetota bacterium]|nr:hypothetical protein [Actinomycetota bacterium]